MCLITEPIEWVASYSSPQGRGREASVTGFIPTLFPAAVCRSYVRPDPCATSCEKEGGCCSFAPSWFFLVLVGSAGPLEEPPRPCLLMCVGRCGLHRLTVLSLLPRLSGLSPFLGETDAETMNFIVNCSWDFDADTFEGLSEEAKDFVSRLLVKEKRCPIASHAQTVAWCPPGGVHGAPGCGAGPSFLGIESSDVGNDRGPGLGELRVPWPSHLVSF